MKSCVNCAHWERDGNVFNSGAEIGSCKARDLWTEQSWLCWMWELVEDNED